MRRLTALLAVSAFAIVLVQGAAQGASEARKSASIKVPSDGNATVAHLVLNAKVKKGKKPKKPVKRPKLKVLKAPKGVVVTASYKRDAKIKNRWHATVAVTNPMGGTTARSTASASQDEVVVVVLVDTDGNYLMVVGGLELFEEITFDESDAEENRADAFIDPPGSAGDALLFGTLPSGVTPGEDLGYMRTLATDGPTSAHDFGELGLEGPVVLLSPFPGNPTEAYADFTIFFPPGPRTAASSSASAAGVNGIALQFPGNTVVAQLPPQGFGGVVTPGTVTWGNKNAAFVSGQTYRANVRLSQPFSRTTAIKVLITTTGGPPYSQPYPGSFVP